MKREELEKIDLTDPKAAIDAIMAMNGKDIEKEKKAIEPLQAQLTTLTGENDTLKGQLKEAGDTIEKFKVMDIDGIKRAADDYKLAAETAKTELEKTKLDTVKQIEALKFDTDLKEILKAEFRDPEDVLHRLNKENIKRGDNGTFIGLKEQIDPLKESKPYLLLDEKDTPRIVTNTTQQTTIPVAGAAAWEAAGLEAPTKK